MKSDIFSKIGMRNYNNELEKILETKDFSRDVKNLLLSMLYKVETSYNDYATVKRYVENKNNFIEKILDNIKLCKKITFINPKDKDTISAAHNRMFKINKEEKTIESFPNEKSLMYAIYYLGNEKMYLNEKYDYIRIVLPAMLNEGKDNNKVEIIRDFNAWSWNNNKDEITNISSNLIFQNLQILLGFDELNDWMEEKIEIDKIKTLEEKLKKKYNNELVDEMLKLIYKIALAKYGSKNKQEEERLKDEFKYVTMEYNKIKNKRAYLSSLTGKKKESLEKIKNIDSILKDDEKLNKEFESRNERLPKYSKLIDIEHLKEVLNKERRKALKDIEECNSFMEPKKYVEEKDKLERQFNILEYLEKEDVNNEILEVQKLFLECLKKKIENYTSKKDLIDNIYLMRYYYYIPYDTERYIQDVTELEQDLNNVIDALIEKIEKEKILNKTIIKENITKGVINSILKTRIINLEQTQIEIINCNDKIEVTLYDNQELETSIEIKNEKDIKNLKKCKIFI